ncbi:MAG: sensor histidine kinase [Eubacterium sp.]
MKIAFVIITGLLLVIIALSAKQIMITKEFKSINCQLNDILNNDTNAIITLSTGDKALIKAVNYLNSNLKTLRNKELLIKSKNDEISTAITNISHDLRTPLTAINGYTEMIEDSSNFEEIKEYSAIISERAKSMSKLTEELFRYSLVLLNKDNVKLEDVCLQTELEKSLAASYTVISEKNINPEISFPEKPVTKRLNRDSLSRIINNILSNASKYSDGDLYISLTDDGIIEFKNTAKGLDEVQVSKLFDRFYTVSNGRESTGIGLSIAKYLTDEMGGKISASYCDDMITVCLNF